MQPNYPLHTFTQALQESWTPETSFDASEWSEDNPARGQCVTSSLVAQDYFGGDLKRYRVRFDENEEMHYCNILPDGTILDTSASQYQWPVTMEPLAVDLKGFSSIREKRLADDDTRHRYELLAGRVAMKLQELHTSS